MAIMDNDIIDILNESYDEMDLDIFDDFEEESLNDFLKRNDKQF